MRAWDWAGSLEWGQKRLSNEVQAVKVQLAAVEEAIFQEYQGRFKQDPTARPRPDVGRLGSLWSHFNFLVWELEQLEETL